MARSPFRSRSRSPIHRSRRGWMVSWWSLWRVPTLVTIVAALWWFGIRPITEEQGWVPIEVEFSLCGEGPRTTGCVVDGDTLNIDRPGERRRRIRLTGFDAPEMEGACEAESALARTARGAVLDWIRQGDFEWDGAGDPPFDQYGRELRAARRVRADGSVEHLADVMIEAGLASESGWSTEPADWCR